MKMEIIGEIIQPQITANIIMTINNFVLDGGDSIETGVDIDGGES